MLLRSAESAHNPYVWNKAAGAPLAWFRGTAAWGAAYIPTVFSSASTLAADAWISADIQLRVESKVRKGAGSAISQGDTTVAKNLFQLLIRPKAEAQTPLVLQEEEKAEALLVDDA